MKITGFAVPSVMAAAFDLQLMRECLAKTGCQALTLAIDGMGRRRQDQVAELPRLGRLHAGHPRLSCRTWRRGGPKQARIKAGMMHQRRAAMTRRSGHDASKRA